jgi:hypothetical protein
MCKSAPLCAKRDRFDGKVGPMELPRETRKWVSIGIGIGIGLLHSAIFGRPIGFW